MRTERLFIRTSRDNVAVSNGAGHRISPDSAADKRMDILGAKLERVATGPMPRPRGEHIVDVLTRKKTDAASKMCDDTRSVLGSGQRLAATVRDSWMLRVCHTHAPLRTPPHPRTVRSHRQVDLCGICTGQKAAWSRSQSQSTSAERMLAADLCECRHPSCRQRGNRDHNYRDVNTRLPMATSQTRRGPFDGLGLD